MESQSPAPAEITVVELSPSSPPQYLLLALLSAYEGTGCFRVVNHGIPASLQAEMKSAVRHLLDLPDAAKRANTDIITDISYIGPTPQNPLYEAFGVYDTADPPDVHAFCACLGASNHHREIIKSYASKIHELAVDLSSKIAESMGMSSYSFEDWPCQFRLNKYNFTEETSGASGVQIQTDSGFLTVLQEDELVGGLEVIDRSGTFVPVNPLPGSLLVNLGDVAKVLGKINCAHRLLNSQVSNFSYMV